MRIGYLPNSRVMRKQLSWRERALFDRYERQRARMPMGLKEYRHDTMRMRIDGGRIPRPMCPMLWSKK